MRQEEAFLKAGTKAAVYEADDGDLHHESI